MRDSSGSGPRREAIQPVFASVRATPVWITNVRVKTKNDFGGFTGFESLYTLAWKKGKIVAYTSGLSPSGHTCSQVLERLVIR